MIRPVTLVTLLAAMGAGLHLYQTKHAVALLDRELRGIGRQITTAQERSVALAAEWAWLNEPERLRVVAQRHLQLEPMQPNQFMRLGEAERRLADAERRLPAVVPPIALAARAEVAPARIEPAPGLRADVVAARTVGAPARGEVVPVETASTARVDPATSARPETAAPARPEPRGEPPTAQRREPSITVVAAAPRPVPRFAAGPQRPAASTAAVVPAAMQSALLPGVAHASTGSTLGSSLGGPGGALPPPVPFAR